MEKIKNLNIKFKIILGIGISFLLVMVVIGGVVGYQFNRLQQENSQNLKKVLLGKERERIKNATHSVAKTFSQIYKEKKGKLSKSELKDLIAKRNSKINFGKVGYFFIYNYNGDTISLPLDRVKEGSNRWDLQDANGKYIIRELVSTSKAGGGFINYIYENPNTSQKEQKFGYVEPIEGTNWFIGAGSYQSVVNSTLNKSKKEISSFKDKTLKIIFGVFILAAIIFTLVVTKISNYITNNLNKILKAMKKLASGDLRISLNINSEDELGKLASGFNSTVSQQRDLITKLLDSIENLSAYSEELSASAQEGNATIKTANEIIEDMSASIQQISASAEEVSSFAQQSNSKTDVGDEHIEETLENMNEISSTVKKTVDVIDELDDTSQEIGGIIELITNIAEQTNLLALNAAIEAARAGEAGQGFAVVAEEIRDLSEETNQATNKITDLIDKIQTKSDTGLDAIRRVENMVQQGRASVEENGEVFAEIQNASKETAVQIQETAAATQDLAQSSDDIMSAAGDVDNMSDEITYSSQELANMAQKLQSLVEEFKV
ncbi:methyl-accepting chemotaxis protein [Halanaerocella petrolearia]